MKRLPLCSGLLLVGLTFSVSAVNGGEPSSGPQLRVQKVGDLTYFHVRLDTPKGMLEDVNRFDRGFFARPAPSLAPRLVGADDQIRLVCQRFNRDRFGRFNPGGPDGFDKEGIPDKTVKEGEKKGPRQAVAVRGLEFMGRTTAKGEVKMKLLYPVEGRRGKLIGRLTRTPPPPVWREKDVVLDFSKATAVAIPAEAAERKEKREKKRDRFEACNRPFATILKDCGPSPKLTSSSISTTRSASSASTASPPAPRLASTASLAPTT